MKDGRPHYTAWSYDTRKWIRLFDFVSGIIVGVVLGYIMFKVL